MTNFIRGDSKVQSENSNIVQKSCALDKNSLSDEKLVTLAMSGSNEAQEMILNKYKNFVRAKARTYFLVGADSDDIVQEGMIGLYKAVRDFKADKLSSFRAFADLCITRQIITAIKTATRNKHLPLNSYISLNKPIYDDDSERTLMDVITEETVCDPEELMLHKEAVASIEVKIGKELSSFEKRVLELYLDGCSYQEIAENLGKHIKSVDNALQRIKKKLYKCIKLDQSE